MKDYRICYKIADTVISTCNGYGFPENESKIRCKRIGSNFPENEY